MWASCATIDAPIAKLPMIKQMLKSVLPRWVWTQLRVARIQLGVSTYRLRCVEHTYGGHALKVWLADPTAAGWYDHDWAALPELTLLSEHKLRPAARVFDIGAHQGVVAMMIARIIGPMGSVLAVEANPHNVEMARRNRDLNGLFQMEVLGSAVGEKSGELSFNCGLNGQVDDGTSEWGSMKVSCIGVDEIADKHGPADVLFIDVEGYELAVLRGAQKTLEQSKPDCFVEVHQGCGLEKLGGSVASLIGAFPRQYRFMFCDPDQDQMFRPLGDPAELPSGRFYLIALG